MDLAKLIIQKSTRVSTRSCIVEIIVLTSSMRRYRVRQRTGRAKVQRNGTGENEEKIPGSIYLPRKHSPTKTETSTETAERETDDRPEDSLKHTKE